MKKLLFLGAILAISTGLRAQLANPGFETLDTLGQASHWGRSGVVVLPIDTNCVWTGSDSVNTITSDAHSGSYAYEMGVATYCDFRYGGNVAARRFDVDSFVDQRTLFTARPVAFTFYYKLSPVIDDEGWAQVILENQNAVVADGLLKLQQAATDWTMATVVLDYHAVDTPEFLTIHFGLHNDTAVHYGSRFLIDDIDYTMTTSVHGLRQQEAQRLVCYPVPAKDELFVSPDGNKYAGDGTLSISDATGRVLKTQQVMLNARNKLAVDVKELPTGMYFVQVLANGVAARGKFLK